MTAAKTTDTPNTAALRQLDDFGLPYTLLAMAEAAYTVEDVARLRGLAPRQVIKAMALVDKDDRAVVALVQGDRRLDLQAASEAWGQKLRIMPRERVGPAIGYGVGAVTPLGLPPGVAVMMDHRVAAMDEISLSSGDHRFGLLLQAADVVELLQPMLADLAADATSPAA